MYRHGLTILSIITALGLGACKTTSTAPASAPAEPARAHSNHGALIESNASALVGPRPDQATGAVVVIVTASETTVMGLGARGRGGADVDGDTTFQIGSITKALTGLMLATIIEDTRYAITADAEVNDHLDALAAPELDGHAITFEHLATHRSGLPRMPDNLTGPKTSPARDYSRAQLSAALDRATLDTSPGTTYLYSNLGSGLLGVALADATGARDFDALLEAQLAAPLGMTRTGTNTASYWTEIGENVARGHNVRGGTRRVVGYADMGVLAGGGEVISTGNDMARLLAVMIGITSPPHLPPEAIERALAPRGAGEPGGQIGYGWNITRGGDGARVYDKAGLTAGFTSYAVFTREPPIAVMLSSNRSNHRAIKASARALLDALRSEQGASAAQ